MTFNEKCDKALQFLKEKADEHAGIILKPGDFEKGCGISMNDPAIWYLDKDMKYIKIDRSKTPFVCIEPAGIVFISKTSFVEEEKQKEKKEREEKEKRDLDLKLGKLSIKTQRLTWTNIGLSIALTSVVVTIQVLNYRRETQRQSQEFQRGRTDSLLQISTSHINSLIDSALHLYIRQEQRKLKINATSVSNTGQFSAEISPKN